MLDFLLLFRVHINLLPESNSHIFQVDTARATPVDHISQICLTRLAFCKRTRTGKSSLGILLVHILLMLRTCLPAEAACFSGVASHPVLGTCATGGGAGGTRGGVLVLTRLRTGMVTMGLLP